MTDASLPSRASLAPLVAAYAARRPGWEPPSERAVRVLDVAQMVAGRPGVVDVVATLGGNQVHLVLGLRRVGDAARFLPGVDDPVLGLVEDADGLAVAFDATGDEDTSTALLEAVAGMPSTTSWALRTPHTATSVTVVFDDRVGLTVFDRPTGSGARWMSLLQSLDDAGFRNLPTPLAFWRRGPFHLGMVREVLPPATSGWAMALGSLRAVLASQVAPEHADKDFAGEAERLGSMVARLHLALERVHGRRPGDVVAWSAAVAGAVRAGAPRLVERDDVRRVLDDLATLAVPCLAIETHGDLHLGRVARTDHGWFVVDGPDGDRAWPGTLAGGTSGSGLFTGTYRSPLADVADVLWSLGHVAALAVAEHTPDAAAPAPQQPGLVDPAAATTLGSAGPGSPVGEPARPGPSASTATAPSRQAARRLADAWERRNRRAFITGYLSVAGIGGLVPADRRALRTVTSAFELEQSVRRSRDGRG